MSKNINFYENESAYNADAERPTNQSTVSVIGDEIRYDGKNIFVTKDTANVGDIVVVQDGRLRYIKLDTYDSSLINIEPIGVVYHKSPDQVRVVYKDNLGSERWAHPFRAKIEGFDLSNGGSYTIAVNGTDYPFDIEGGMTLDEVGNVIEAEVGFSDGITIEVGANYIVLNRSHYTPAINTFTSEDLEVTILNDDRQARYSGLLTPELNIARNNGVFTSFANANLLRSIAYREVSGSDDRNVGLDDSTQVKRELFNFEDNPLIFSEYGTYEKCIESHMTRYPYSKGAITDKNGEKNTRILAAETFVDDDQIEKPKYPAASKAQEAEGGGLDWWLPSFEELFLLISKIGGEDDVINRSLSAIGGNQLSISSYYWSSTERSTHYSWGYYGNNGCMSGRYKTYSYTVRSVSAF